jgi:hypothetical protein
VQNRKRRPIKLRTREAQPQQRFLVKKIGRLVDMGFTMPQIHSILGSEHAQSSLYHYSSVYRLIKRAEPLVSEQGLSMLENSGLRFVHSVPCLLALDDTRFTAVIEFLADPHNGCNITMLPRDRLTQYVLQTVREWPAALNMRKDLLHHRLRDTVGRMYLWKNGIPACTEVAISHADRKNNTIGTRHGLRCDILGMDLKGRFYMIEVKTSLNDLKKGMGRIEEYRQYAHFFSILTSDMDVRDTILHTMSPDIGVLFYDIVEQCLLPEYSREAAFVDIALSPEEHNNITYYLCRKAVLDMSAGFC